MTQTSETGQSKYPEIVLGKPIRPFTPEEVDLFLERRETNLEAQIVRHFNLDKFPIIIFIEPLARVYEGDVRNHRISPFGKITITETIDSDGTRRKTEGFESSIVDNFTFQRPRPAQTYSVTVELNGVRIEGSKPSYGEYRFGFGQWGSSRGFLIPEKLDLSQLEYTFAKKEE